MPKQSVSSSPAQNYLSEAHERLLRGLRSLVGGQDRFGG